MNETVKKAVEDFKKATYEVVSKRKEALRDLIGAKDDTIKVSIQLEEKTLLNDIEVISVYISINDILKDSYMFTKEEFLDGSYINEYKNTLRARTTLFLDKAARR